eukprot:1061356-Prorocentrum_minimum.AAC.1
MFYGSSCANNGKGALNAPHIVTCFQFHKGAYKSAFYNSCILHARNAGDTYTAVLDLDEQPVHGYGNVSIQQALSTRCGLQ